MKTIARISAILLPFIAAISLAFPSSAFASQGLGNQWDAGGAGHYINAWSGTTEVNNYNGQALNNDFTAVPISGGAWELQLTNAPFVLGSTCISDENNQQFIARAGLYDCNSDIPWGARFEPIPCFVNGRSGDEWYDIHWNNFLHAGTGNGNAFYLNTTTPTCYVQENPY
jgi:hypothetical protein